MPFNIDINSINDGSGIHQTLEKNKAGYHKYCRLGFSTTLTREIGKKSKNEDVSNESSSPVKTRQKLSPTPTKKNICFFCENSSDKGILHCVTTLHIDNNVKNMATELSDTKLLTKLADRDMIAADAMYHLNCYVGLCNRYRAHSSKSNNKDIRNKVSVDALVVAELVAYIKETSHNEENVILFKLSDLTKKYDKRCAEIMQVDASTITNKRSTSLKERLQKLIPELWIAKQGKEVILTLSENIGPAIQYALNSDMDEDAVKLSNAAQLIRKEMFEMSYKFSGSFEDDCELNSVPQSLISLVHMILEGGSSFDENEINYNTQRKRITVAIAQLLQFNSVKKSRAKAGIRHIKERETPLSIYISMLIHAKTRSRHLIDTLSNLGLCVSYNRLMNISTDLANTVCTKYHEDQVVCPLNLSNGTFTCGAVDNIDHNPSARTAKDSFHGTAISLMQFPTSETPGVPRVRIQQDIPRKSKILPLPQSYTLVHPVTKTLDPIVPVKKCPINADESIVKVYMKKEHKWLSHLSTMVNKDSLDGGDYASWAAHSASEQPPQSIIPSTIALLPLFRENAHSTCMMAHAMQMVINATHHLNPSQTPVIVSDQPLYALCKQIQWTWPQKYGEDKIVIMMGGLHIEMNLLKLLGDWLRGSGWIASLVQANVTTSGRAEAMLSGSHVTRARYAHQVTAGSLKILVDRAYQQYLEKYTEGETTLTFDEWSYMQSNNEPQFKFWITTLNLELMVLQFIRSIRERDFHMYIQALLKVVPWLFAFNHVNYAHWLPVHISDMVNLPTTHPGVYHEFMKGNFAVNKTSNIFSAMAIDQCHEQLNDLIKGDGGAVGLTENPQALERWMIAGPEISRLIQEFENCSQTSRSKKSRMHHKQNPSTQNDFVKDVKSLVATLEEMGNPFLEDSGDLLTIDTKIIKNKEVVQTVFTIETKGKKQYATFVNERITTAQNKPLSTIISKNKLTMFGAVLPKLISKTKQQITDLKSNCDLFGRLYIGCQFRQGDMNTFFAHENGRHPPSISELGELKPTVKSDLVDCLEQLVPPNQAAPRVDVKILDGAVVIHLLKPRGSRTFKDYYQNIFLPYVKLQLEDVARVDVVWDSYLPNSLKQSTRQRRTQSGSTQRQRVDCNTPIPPNWESFLRSEQNKNELFIYLAKCMQSYDIDGKILVSTLGKLVVTAGQHDLQDMESLQPCSHEEADTRIILHVAHCAKQGYRRIAIRTVDTDIVVLAVGHVQSLDIEELWICFGVGKHYRYIAAHAIANFLQEKAKALMMFHALTGCDTVSSFRGRGKKTAWTAWLSYPKVTETFLALLSLPIEDIDQNILNEIERFIIVVYSKTCTLSRVNEARRELFTQGFRTIENIPPTQAALLEHLKRAVYQAAHVWSQALDPSPKLPSPENWGWQLTESVWKPLWTKLPEAAVSCSELVHCGCKKGCKHQCKCRVLNLECTEQCNCKGKCNTD